MFKINHANYPQKLLKNLFDSKASFTTLQYFEGEVIGSYCVYYILFYYLLSWCQFHYTVIYSLGVNFIIQLTYDIYSTENMPDLAMGDTVHIIHIVQMTLLAATSQKLLQKMINTVVADSGVKNVLQPG